jgi:hypothetical protein
MLLGSFRGGMQVVNILTACETEMESRHQISEHHRHERQKVTLQLPITHRRKAPKSRECECASI